MSFTKNVLLGLGMGLSLLANAGERGGGVSPAPVFAPEDITVVCEIEHVQLGSEIHRALTSKSEVSFSWKKGEYAGTRGVDLKDIQDWEHYTMHVGHGPFPMLEEVTELPKAASFGGYVRMSGQNAVEKITLDLDVSVSVEQDKVRIASNSSNRAHIDSEEGWKASVRQTQSLAQGNIKDQRILNVRCTRSIEESNE